MLDATATLQVPGYQIVRHLGTGAGSTIYEVRNRQTNEHFALKRIVKRSARDQRFSDQALNEYRVSQQVDHPIIRKTLRLRRVRLFFRTRELQMFMELCPGETLQARRPQAIGDILHVFGLTAEAVAQMNTQGWVHADLKPNNILVAPDGTVKIIDLGQSCPVGKVKQRIQGTPDYIAPEQVKRQPLDSRTDVYNFGATLYWVLTGKPIRTVLPNQGQITLKSDLRIDPPEESNPRVPPALSKLVMDCIELLPSRRPQGMEAVVSRLGLVRRAMVRTTSPNVADQT